MFPIFPRLLIVGALVALLSLACSTPSRAPQAPPGQAAAGSDQAHDPLSPASLAAAGLPNVPLSRGDTSRGQALTTRAGCIGCHTIRGSGGTIGPDLSEVAVRAPARAAEAGLERPELYFIQSIVNPQAYIVEGYGPLMIDWKAMNLTEQDLADLVAFLLTLKP